MAKQEVSGKTDSELVELRQEFLNQPRSKYWEFEEYFCLAGPLCQPEDYEGPDRYCSAVAKQNGRCRYHGGNNVDRSENLDKLAALKHSMYASEDTIRETMDEEEREMYDWVMSWADVYEIDVDEDPAALHDLQTLAIEVVRQKRSSHYILTNTEVTQEGVYTPAGELLEQKDVPNSLIDAHQSQIRLIAKIKDTLNITRKQQARGEQAESASESMDALAGALSDLVGGSDGGEYDPEEFEEGGD